LNPDDFVNHIRSGPNYRGQVVYDQDIPAQPARFAELSEDLSPVVKRLLDADGIEQLYTHQVDAIEAIRGGKHVVIVTGTASGKTLCYNVPVLEALVTNPGLRALYMFPTKALAQDQLRTLNAYRDGAPELELIAGTYDGDTPRNQRRTLRDEANIILTNPDMLHAGILPNHARWGHFFEQLRFVVIDEMHTYRGIFGSHVANVIRRLRRICEHYEARPLFVCCSATIGNPGEFASDLVGLPVTVVDNDGSPRGAKKFVLWNPPMDESAMERRSPNVEAQRLMTGLIESGVQTITFARARVTAEILYRYVRESLRRISPSLANAVSPYRGGYLPEERRAIEKRLFDGELMGVTTTNALELGIDIGSLDAAILVGYPGTVASTWQQVGRAGRGEERSLAVLIGRDTAIDQYLMHHPSYLFGRSPENAIIDSDNPYVVAAHLRCAAQELPIAAPDHELFGDDTAAIAEVLGSEGELNEVQGRWYWRGHAYPAGDFGLRNADDNNYVIQDVGRDNKVIGEIDEWGAFTLLHTEAIYLHEGETYFVENLDLEQRIAYVRQGEFDYYTVSVDRTTIRLLDDEHEVRLQKRWRVSDVGLDPVEVTNRVHMFRKVKFYSMDSIGFGSLNLPPLLLETQAFWIQPPLETLKRVRECGRVPFEGLLGVANAVTGVMPLRIMCEPADVGSVVDSANFGRSAIFVYDRYREGIGFAQKLYEVVEDVFSDALALIEDCSCERGCPSCVGAPLPHFEPQSGDIETRGRIPDREAALIILHDLLEREPYEPRPLSEEMAERNRQILAQATPRSQPRARPAPPPEPAEPMPRRELPPRIEQGIRQRVRRRAEERGRRGHRDV